MDSHLLKVFVTVAKEQSISHAATRLDCAQSNVTSRIKQLEKNLGFKLFNRVSKGVKLTYEGEKLLPDAQEIVYKIESTISKMKDLDSNELVRLGSTQVNTPIRLIPLITKIKKEQKDIKLQLYTNTSLLVADALLNYELDIAYICGRPESKNLKVLKKYDEELYIIESKDEKQGSSIFTYIKSCIYYKHLAELLKEEDKNYETVVIQNYETILACVELGMGKAILPLNLIKKYAYENRVKLTKVNQKDKDFSTYLVCRKDYESPIKNSLL